MFMMIFMIFGLFVLSIATHSIGEKSTSYIYGSDDKVVPINATTISELDDWHVKDEELRQEILSQFDIINTDLKEVEQMFSTRHDYNKSADECSNQTILPRSVRSLPLDRSTICEVEHAVLVNFKNELIVTLSGTNQAGNSNCEINSNADTCDELIRLILCGYIHLKNGFTRATENIAKLDEAAMWKNKFENYKEKSTRLLNDKIRFLSQENQRKIDSFKTDLQTLQRKANGYIEKIEDYGPTVCAYEIQNGNIYKALVKFEELIEFNFDESVLLDKIIEKAYSNVENLIKFIRVLPYITQCLTGFSHLFEKMKNNNHLGSHHLILFAYKVDETMKKTNYPNIDQDYKDKFTDLKNNLSPYVNNIIDAWAYKVRNNNDIGQIKDFSEKHSEAFKANLADLIVKAYANTLYYVENVIEFIRDLPYISQLVIGYSSLFENMKYNNHLDSYQLIFLASRVKDVMEQKNYPNIDQDYKDQFTALKSSLPSSVRDLIWKGNDCTIQNRYKMEDLYAGQTKYNSLRRYAFTWTPKGSVLEGYWEFELLYSLKSFTIRNDYQNEYLYAGYPTYDSKNRYVLTWKYPVLDAQWEITPCNSGEYFSIRNYVKKEYLYVGEPKYNSKRRYVFTWRRSELASKCQWQINC